MILIPDFGYGGAERSAAAVSMLLAETFDVYFVVFNTKIKQAYKTGGEIYSLDVEGGSTFFLKAINFLKRVGRLKRLKRELGIHICLSFLEGADYINVLSKNDDKVILNVRGSKKYDPNISGLGGRIRRSILIPSIYNRANTLTTVSKSLHDELIRDIGIKRKKPIFVIPNFFNVDELRSKAKERLLAEWDNLFEGNQTIITVGRISHEKGFDRFVPVFERLLKMLPETRWIVVGDGPCIYTIQRKLKKRGISYWDGDKTLNFSAKVFFVGYQSNPHKWVSRSTLFVLSSLTEGFPNALLEAMSVGIPVLASDCPYGPAEILSEKQDEGSLRTYGVLLPLLTDVTSTVECWCQQLFDLLTNETIRQNYKRQSIIRSHHFSPEFVRQLWHSVLLKTFYEEENTNHR